MPQITYTGTFKVIQQIVDWINNFTPSIGGLDDLTDVDISSPQNDDVLKYNSTTQKWENGTGGSGSGGHTIVDPNDTSMPQENKLQFTGAVSVSDDSTNGQTVVNVSGGVFYSPSIYSTEEREIGCWTDGKPLYQKTWILNSVLSCASNTWVDTPIPNTGMQRIIKGFANDIFDNGGVSQSNSFLYLSFAVNAPTYVRILNARPSTITVCAITLQYTKTADVAGSGSWTPSGVPSAHYSETEEVVGTWIDGKPIYQKTVKFLSQALAAGDNDLNLGIPTIDTVVDSKAMITNSAHTTYRPLNAWTTASSGQLFYLIEPSSGKLRVHTEGAWASPNIFITLQYTKITS